MRIEIVVFPGVDELDALGPLEVLRNAVACGADFEVRLVSLDGTTEIGGAHGLHFSVDGKLGSNGRPDLLIVPGGGWVKRSAEGAWAEGQRGTLPAAVRQAYERGTTLGSVCTGAMLVALTGLLRGRRAVTHHDSLEELRQSGARVVSARVVDDGDILSAGGVTSGIDLALHLVERFASRELAERVAREMEYERRGQVDAGTLRGQSARVQVTS
jgi:transcriptional regulator GlxA family with amidase domain